MVIYLINKIMTNMDKIRQLWKQYDEASNKATDRFVQSLEVRRQGNQGLANYIELKVLPKVQKESYKSFLLYSQECEKLDTNNGK